MSSGEVIQAIFTLIPTDPSVVPTLLELPAPTSDYNCCYIIPVLAKPLGAGGDLFNDQTGRLYRFNSQITSVTLFLQKDSGSGFVDVKTLNNNDFGTFFPFAFEILDGNKYIGYLIEWSKVLDDADLGVGQYRLRIELTDIFTNVNNRFSCAYSLKVYTPFSADKTVRFDFFNNRLKGDDLDPSKVFNYGDLNWFDQMRLPNSIFGENTSEYEQETILFGGGVSRNIENNQEPEYIFRLRRAPFFIHDYLKTTAFMADEILLTDYNTGNRSGPFRSFRVIHSGSYAPNWDNGAQEPSSETKFKLRQNNLKDKRC